MIAFTKVKLPFGWMGNMSPHPITIDGVVWKTSEALFQALRFTDPAIKELIRAERSPMGAKMRAKANAEKATVVPASAEDVANMEACLRLKLAQHPDLAKALKDTGDQPIYEDVTKRAGGRHIFWGAALQDGEWKGENTLGKLWMKLRGEL